MENLEYLLHLDTPSNDTIPLLVSSGMASRYTDEVAVVLYLT
jgi:hypothetical protein